MKIDLKMFTLFVVVLFISAALSEDPRPPPHYTQRGCTPVASDDGSTPQAYDCSAVDARSNALCYNDGVAFAPGTVIDYPYDNLTNHYVGLGRLTVYEKCTCKPKSGDEIFEFAHFECELPVPTQGQDEEKPNDPAHKCLNGENSFNDGEIMYGYSESKCDRCVCRKGKPVCRPLSCGFDLFSWTEFLRGCVPAYDEGSCCDRTFMRCPKENDEVIPSSTPSTSGLQCRFGDLTLNIGDSIPFDPETCNECSCQLPPMLTCSGRKDCRPLRVI